MESALLTEKTRRLVFVGLLSLVPMAASVISVAGRVESIWSPFPFVSFWIYSLPAPRPLLILGVSLVFLVANLGAIRRSKPRGAWLSAALAAILALTSIVYFWIRLPLGFEYQGAGYSTAMMLVNLVFLITFCLCWWRWRRNRTSLQSLSLSLIVFIWVLWFAFPYFGEAI